MGSVQYTVRIEKHTNGWVARCGGESFVATSLEELANMITAALATSRLVDDDAAMLAEKKRQEAEYASALAQMKAAQQYGYGAARNMGMVGNLFGTTTVMSPFDQTSNTVVVKTDTI